jgi:transglutaminase-like putative cysteine protease
MNYSVHHVTRFHYSAPITESVMEVYMHPRTEGNQRCLNFKLSVNPRAQIFSHRDYLGNTVNHFDIPRPHTRLSITAEALVEIRPVPELPHSLDIEAWARLDSEIEQGDFWDMLIPSRFIEMTPLVHELARELRVEQRHDDPLSLLRELNTAIYTTFDYDQESTEVDSPIDHALENRKGVCQDFAHIMITLVRNLHIPCRYVSGYLFTGADDHDRSAEDATHAWVEAYLPGLGWVGFDPTNNLVVADRHIRVAIGRDYADVPPSRGVFKGAAETELSVSVRVHPASEIAHEEANLPEPDWPSYDGELEDQAQQQQQ